jgi:putative hemolysin
LDQPPSPGGDDPLSSILAILVCLLLSFVFAGSETAITSMGEHRVRRLIEQKAGPRGFFELWLSDHSAVLTGLLTGNTLVNIGASAIVTSLTLGLSMSEALPVWMRGSVVSVGVFVLTLLVLVGGEIMPKTLAKNRPEWFLRAFWLVYGFHLATRWLTRGLTWIAKWLVRKLGVETESSGFLVTEEQIEDMVRIGSEEGSIDMRRGDLLKNVFDLWDTSVRAIMTPRTEMVGLSVDATIEDILVLMRENGYSRYPVFDGGPDHVVGVFYAKALMEADFETRNAAGFNLRENLREALFVPETQKASSLLQTFRARAIHLAVVVDEHGGTAGVVTLEDVLEELVGDIYDEYDEIEAVVEEISDGVWHADGSAEMRDIADKARAELPEDAGYSTVAGYVFHHLGRMPEAGDGFVANGMQITVLAADSKKVQRVEIQRLADNGDTEQFATAV